MKTEFNVSKPIIGRFVDNDYSLPLFAYTNAFLMQPEFRYVETICLDAVERIPTGSVVKTREYDEGDYLEFLIYPDFHRRGRE
jgi:hypothetical protein